MFVSVEKAHSYSTRAERTLLASDTEFVNLAVETPPDREHPRFSHSERDLRRRGTQSAATTCATFLASPPRPSTTRQDKRCLVRPRPVRAVLVSDHELLHHILVAPGWGQRFVLFETAFQKYIVCCADKTLKHTNDAHDMRFFRSRWNTTEPPLHSKTGLSCPGVALKRRGVRAGPRRVENVTRACRVPPCKRVV